MAPPAAVPKPKTKGVYTWKQVAEHNNEKSAWVVIGGKVYDITAWMDKHPGGKEMLLLAAGREITHMYESYHPFTDLPDKRLALMEIGTVSDYEFVQYGKDTGFYQRMTKEVKAYFEKNKLDPRDPMPGLWRMAIVFSVAALMYCIVNNVVGPFSWGVKLAAAVVFGIVQALPLLHVMHDASHTAIGSNELWWKSVGRFCMEWYAGASMMSWHHQHVVGHHIYTNVLGVDPDMPVAESGDPRRIVKRQKWTWVYRFQWLYLPVLYGVLGLKFRVQDITDTFGSKTNGPVRVNVYDSPAIRLWAVKIFWATWRIVVPLCVLGVPQKEYWTLFLITELMTGYWLAFNFQVSHVSTVADFPAGEEPEDVFTDEWAVSQIKSSVDYAHGDWITTFVSGALNYQITHHLFPGVSQYHYPAIAPIIRKFCEKEGVHYTVLSNFTEAFKGHMRHLYLLGKAGKRAHMD